MRFVVIGLGSMGKRRIRLLKEYIDRLSVNSFQNGWDIFGVDNRSDRCSEIKIEFGISTYHSLEETLNEERVDAAFVCTSPLSHSVIVSKCLSAGLDVFTEINVVADGYFENIDLAKKKERVLYLSSTPMKRKEMHYIRDWVQNENRNVTYRYSVGQYLPEWHPWENYEDFFVKDKRTNGCRELFAIELPWIVDAFGKVNSYFSQHSRLTKLNLDYDDAYQVLIRHDTGLSGVLMIDIASPNAGRRMEIFGEKSYLIWEGTPDKLKVLNNETDNLEQVNLYQEYQHREGYNSFVIEDAYFEEIVEFVSCIKERKNPSYSFEKDFEILKLIDGIEK